MHLGESRSLTRGREPHYGSQREIPRRDSKRKCLQLTSEDSMNVSVGEVVPFTAPHATEQICGGHGVRLGVRSLSALRPTLLRRLPMRRGALFVRSATR